VIRPLEGRRVLLFSLRFFRYEEDIAEELRAEGAVVDLFNERPRDDFFAKVAIRIDRRLMHGEIERYHRAIIEQTRTRDYDFVLFIKAEAVSAASLTRLRRYHPRARFILYLWDSLRNSANARRIRSQFDRILSFDPVDCRDDARLVHRPLFYTEDFAGRGVHGQCDVDVLFVGTVHSDRFRFVQAVQRLCVEAGLRISVTFYFPSRVLFLARKTFDSSFRGVEMGDFAFAPLSRADVVDRMSRSRCVLDVQHPGQRGLTMRTIEALGARKKLITTNSSIRDSDLYHPDNVLVVDRADPALDRSFFARPYHPYRDEVYAKYSLQGWLRDIFGHGSTPREDGGNTR
jgi:hypothetical protein